MEEEDESRKDLNVGLILYEDYAFGVNPNYESKGVNKIDEEICSSSILK